jgi:hypothetical protein
MIEKLKSFFDAVPEHWIAVVIILAGAAVAITHAVHSYEVGTGLTSAGLALYKGKQ